MRLALEQFVSEQRTYHEGFRYIFPRPVVMIREVGDLKVVPLAKADLPAVRVEAAVKAWLFARESRVQDGWGPGILDVDVQLTVHGTVAADGTYNIDPKSAILKSWWRDMVMVESRGPTVSSERAAQRGRVGLPSLPRRTGTVSDVLRQVGGDRLGDVSDDLVG